MVITVQMKCDTSATELNSDASIRSHVRLVDLVPTPLRSVCEFFAAGPAGAALFSAGQTVYVTLSTTPPPP